MSEPRDPDLRLARLHLRVGLYSLARAELETMAGRATLDTQGLADLAEVRWRTGDLVGAREAAAAHVDTGGDEVVPRCILAESMATEGQEDVARAAIAQIVAEYGPALDAIFAGQPRSDLWPIPIVATAPRPVVSRVAGGPAARPTPAAVVAGDAAATGVVGTTGVEAAPPPVPTSAQQSIAAASLSEAQAMVGDGRTSEAATRLAISLRMGPALAPAVLAVANDALRDDSLDDRERAALNVVRGDAYRALGRESAAREAFLAADTSLGHRLDAALGEQPADVDAPRADLPQDASSAERDALPPADPAVGDGAPADEDAAPAADRPPDAAPADQDAPLAAQGAGGDVPPEMDAVVPEDPTAGTGEG